MTFERRVKGPVKSHQTRPIPGRSLGFLGFAIALALIAGACSHARPTAVKPAKAADVNESRLVHADREPGNWMAYGRTYDEQRFSPLTQINDHNVSQLGLAWYFDLDTHREQEATPVVVDGIMYFTTAWSKVFALNAVTGQLLWSFDPKVPGGWAVNACCDVVNRGVAAWNGKVIFGTLDGRLIALEAVRNAALPQPSKAIW